jgi:hypothetical protein
VKTTHPTTETARNTEKNLTGEDAMATRRPARPPDPLHAARIPSGEGAGMAFLSNPSLAVGRPAAGDLEWGKTEASVMLLCWCLWGMCQDSLRSQSERGKWPSGGGGGGGRTGGGGSRTVESRRSKPWGLGFSPFVTFEDGQTNNQALKTKSGPSEKQILNRDGKKLVLAVLS